MIGIVAINRLGVIGDQGRIPWATNSEDMQHFVAVTNEAKDIFVGRLTWEGLPEAARKRLAKQYVTVLTRNERPYSRPVRYLHWDRTQHDCAEYDLWHYQVNAGVVIGGAQTYDLLHDIISVWHVTELDNSIEGDTTMPRYWEDREMFGLYAERAIDGGVIKTYRRWL